MSTKSAIITKLPNGRYLGTTCHYDGYLSHVGRILSQDYTNLGKITELIKLGQLSVLGKSLMPSPLVKQYGFDYFGNSKFLKLPKAEKDQLIKQSLNSNYTKAYHRNRGESKIGPWNWPNWRYLKSDITSNITGCGIFEPVEFIYVFENGYWWLVAGGIDTKVKPKKKWAKVKKLSKQN